MALLKQVKKDTFVKLNNFLHKKETQAFQKAKIQNSTKESKQIFLMQMLPEQHYQCYCR